MEWNPFTDSSIVYFCFLLFTLLFSIVLLCRYRPAPEEEGSSTLASSPKKTKAELKSSKAAARSKKDELWCGELFLYYPAYGQYCITP